MREPINSYSLACADQEHPRGGGWTTFRGFSKGGIPHFVRRSFHTE
jgi:hypothetical protein